MGRSHERDDDPGSNPTRPGNLVAGTICTAMSLAAEYAEAHQLCRCPATGGAWRLLHSASIPREDARRVQPGEDAGFHATARDAPPELGRPALPTIG
jgi:hypothetical protein